MSDYNKFLSLKRGSVDYHGFDVKDEFINDMLYDWQKHLVSWSLKKGRSAIFADCGLGKTPIQLEWANQIVKKENKRILILTPLAVSQQTVLEGKKFGIECEQSREGVLNGKKIVVTNYERLHYFDPKDFIGVVCDESSVLKHFTGVRQKMVTEFMKNIPFRLLCTATAAPNDYTELGTSSEAIGEMGYMDMLTRFFRNVDNSTLGKSHGFRHKHKDRLEAFRGKSSFWRFKKHAEDTYWRWISSWSRALKKPSDIGNYDDSDFILPNLIETQYEIENTRPFPGELFPKPAVGLREEREEIRATLNERCEKVAEIVNNTDDFFIVWCQLNDEGDYLEKIIPDAVQIAGKHSDDKKEETLTAFSKGNIRGIVTKSKITGFGLNWQHCNKMTFFPSHSFEMYYQSIRRCWRFGQERDVVVDMITTPGMKNAISNLRRKSKAAEKMFSKIIDNMNNSLNIKKEDLHKNKMEVPQWL